jgi:hypothetical protein
MACALHWAHQDSSVSLEHSTNMAWQPVQVGQPKQRFPARQPWQPTQGAQSTWPVKALQQQVSYPQQEIMPMPDETVVMKFPVNRRGLSLIGATLLSGAVLGGPAFALIPDDEDADLLAKAKANRKQRIQAEKKEERKYVEAAGDEGGKAKLDRALAPVQIAIKQLAIAGADLQKGDTAAAGRELQTTMINDLKSAIEKTSNTGDAKALTGTIFKSVTSLQSACNSNKLKEAKTAFVETAKDLKDWAAAADVDELLRGL